MPDLTSAPLVAPPAASLWPQPPQQQPGFGSNPSGMLDLITKMQQNYQLSQELKARAAIGQAYQGALQPDGTLDQEKLRAGLADPAASWLLPDAMTHVLSQQTQQFNLRAAQDQQVRSILGNLPDNANAETLRHVGAQLARMQVPPALITGWLSSAPSDPKQMKDWIAAVRNLAMSPEAVSAPTPGSPGAGGEPTNITRGQFNRATAGGGLPTGLSPDQTASITHMQAVAQRQGTFADEMFQWDELRRSVKKFEDAGGEFGEGSAVRNRVKSFIQTLSPDAARFLGINPNDVNSYETAKKLLLRAVQARQQAIGGHTDEMLKTTVGASPNVEMTNLTLNELVNMSVAQRRAEYAQHLWSSDRGRGGGPNYTANTVQWARENDIRAFGLDTLSPGQQARVLGSLKPGTAEYDRFNRSLDMAKRMGMADPMAESGGGAPAARPAAGLSALQPPDLPAGARGVAPAPPVAPARISPTSGVPANYHDVQPGETLADIARSRGLTVREIAASDPYIGPMVQRDPSYATARLPPGYRVALPAAAGPAAPPSRAAAPAAAPIAPRTVPTVPAPSASAPGLPSGYLTPNIAHIAAAGDPYSRPAIPAFTAGRPDAGRPDLAGGAAQVQSPPALPTPPVHTVARGQTLGQVANKYGVSAADIAAQNGISPAKVRPGMKLTIPGPHPAAQWGRLPNSSMGWVIQHDGRWHQYIRGE